MSARGPLGDLLSLDGQVALVTGAAGGIGAAVAARLREAGARVAGVDLPGRAAAGEDAIAADVAEPGGVQALFEEVRERFGRVDVLVHAAGVTRDAVLWKMDEEQWSAVMRVNLDAAFLLLREAAPMMRAAGDGGAVVLISSINGERGKFGQANYAASKAGLIGLGRTAARELGRFGIRVNVLAPGMIETPMTARLPERFREEAVAESALGRIGEPDDVARAVLFLVSPLGRHVTGQVLRVDGGQLIG